jgi:hypothetical protein
MIILFIHLEEYLAIHKLDGTITLLIIHLEIENIRPLVVHSRRKENLIQSRKGHNCLNKNSIKLKMTLFTSSRR